MEIFILQVFVGHARIPIVGGLECGHHSHVHVGDMLSSTTTNVIYYANACLREHVTSVYVY